MVDVRRSLGGRRPLIVAAVGGRVRTGSRRARAPIGVALSLAAMLLLGACVETASPSDTYGADPTTVDDDASTPASADGAETGNDVGTDDGEPVEVGPGQPVTIVRVIDGDSLEVLLADGAERELRLEGINAPELNALGGGRTCAGTAARDELEAILSAGAVTLTGSEVDRFDRLLATLWVDGVPANAEMVRAGWALGQWSGDQRLVGVMIDAAEAGAGWWGTDCGAPRRGPVIGDTQANAPGDDRENLDQEWVELVNRGDDRADLDGWVLRDETTSNRFLLDGVSLAPGATLRVHTGAGASDDGSLYLDEDFPVWSNSGETVLLVDPDGLLVDWAFLPG
ncbi:MAG: lamin tail domain-containing protein [Actinomycetota bacterium]